MRRPGRAADKLVDDNLLKHEEIGHGQGSEAKRQRTEEAQGQQEKAGADADDPGAAAAAEGERRGPLATVDGGLQA
jgi:hypothetical protein